MKELINFAINNQDNNTSLPLNQLLEENNLNTEQWNSFLDLLNDLDLNKQGASILLEEIKSGKVLLG